MDTHEHINTIDATRVDWTSKVRLTRMWPTLKPDGSVARYNMILLDCKNTHIHATVTPALLNLINPDVLEGVLYEISYVRVLEPRGVLRPVRTPKFIIFLPFTVMNKIFDDDMMIHMHKFELTPLADLFDHSDSSEPSSKPLYATDVMGVMEDLHPVHTLRTKSGDIEVVRFNISDGRHSYRVLFFGPIGHDTESLYSRGFQNPVILILACVRISQYGGEIHITNLRGTRIFFDLDYPNVFLMRQRLVEQGHKNPQAE